MRTFGVLLLALWIAVPGFAAAPGTAQNFLERANRLKAKGPLAFFDSEYGRLKAEATAVGKSIGDDRIAAERALGRGEGLRSRSGSRRRSHSFQSQQDEQDGRCDR